MAIIQTEEQLVLNLFVGNSEWQDRFDSLEIWRSRTGVAGPYENLTANDWSSARLPLGAADAPGVPVTGPSVVIVGKSLKLRVNEDDDVVVTFTGGGSLTFAQAATQIVAQGLGLLRAYVVGSVLAIETVKVGGAAILRVVGGEAAPTLGFSTTEPTNLAFGHEARIRLVADKEAYSFTDFNGDTEFYYKTRFFNGLDGTFSGGQESQPICYTFAHVHSPRVHHRSQRPGSLALAQACLPEPLMARRASPRAPVAPPGQPNEPQLRYTACMCTA